MKEIAMNKNSSNIPSFNLDNLIRLIDTGESSASGSFGNEETTKKKGKSNSSSSKCLARGNPND
jgi:hypothetical protein